MAAQGEAECLPNKIFGEPENGSYLRRRKLIECAQNTFEQVSEILKQKVPCVGHVLAPKRLWLKQISTPNCDVVMAFPSNTNDSVLLWLLSRLRQTSCLTVQVCQHVSTQSKAFYLTAPLPILLRAAEEYHLPKELKASKGGGLKEFTVKDVHFFKASENAQLFLTSQERQWLILKILESIRAKPSDASALSGVNLVEGQLLFPKCLSAGIIAQVFPLHEPAALEKLQHMWVQEIWAPQPLDNIAEYFGVKIAMYFAWLGHYTIALSIPAVVGFLFWVFSNGKHQTIEDIGYVLFSVFNIVWITTYLQCFKRYSAELAFRWGTLDQRDDLLAESRPMYRGDLKRSEVTGRLEPWSPIWKRQMYRYCVSVPIIAICLAAVFFVMIASLHIQDWWDNQLKIRGFPLWFGYLPKILLAIFISLMDEAYFKVAVWLNDKAIKIFNVILDTYRLVPNHVTTICGGAPFRVLFLPMTLVLLYGASALVISILDLFANFLKSSANAFQFINSFLSLFYIAFYLQDQDRLKEQLAALLISRQIIGNFKESVVPYFLEHVKLAKISFEMWGALSPTEKRSLPGTSDSPTKKDGKDNGSHDTDKRSMNQAELETSLYKYEGTFSEHLEMTIQLGYVILFSSAFPPAAVCAIFNNMIEIRSDAFKLAYVCQRPFGQRVPNIGTWQQCMECMSIIAVLVNCALIGLSGEVHRMFPDMTPTQTIILIVALEHIMLCIRFLITCAIPDIPSWLATEMAKIEWARREVSRLATTSPSPEDSPSKSIGRFSVSPSHSLIAASLPGVVKSELSKEGAVATLTEELNNKKASISSESKVFTPTSLKPPVSITSESIQAIPPFKPRKSKDFQPENDHHLTVGPSTGSEMVKKFKEENESYRSTDCVIPKLSGDASSSDSDLLKASPILPLWPPRARSPSSITPTDAALKNKSIAAILSEEAKIAAKLEASKEAAKAAAAEELAAKKTRVKQSLMKRARSVAIFSLKLKERRAREAAEKNNKPATPTAPLPPTQSGGGELTCIPIEKLIQLEDLRHNASTRSSQSGPSS